MSSSLLITSSIPGAGLRGISEGNVADEGVFNAGKVGLGDRGVLMMGTKGVGVGEADTVGEVDDEADPSVADEGGDDASDEVGEGMVSCSTLNTTIGGVQGQKRESNACGGQRVSRGSKQRRKERSCRLSGGDIWGTGIETSKQQQQQHVPCSHESLTCEASSQRKDGQRYWGDNSG